MIYNIQATDFKSSSEVTLPSTANAREWWAIESRRCGTDWISLITAAEQVLRELHVLHPESSS